MTMSPGSIPAFLLKEWFSISMVLILKIYTYPNRSKVLTVIRFQKGNWSDIVNYRPISPICNFGKIFKICINELIYKHISSHIVSGQNDFVSERSTVWNLASITQYLSAVLVKNGQVDVIYTFFSNAFDRYKPQRMSFSNALQVFTVPAS